MQKLKIEKNIPLVERQVQKNPRLGLYKQLLEMEVGDSFLITDTMANQTQINNSIKHVRTYMGVSSIVFKSKKCGKNKRRYWKIAM